MYIRLLGAVGVGSGADDVVPAPGRIPGAVLAHLALAGGRLVTTEALIDKVWDDPGTSPRNAVHGAVGKLRDAFGDELVKTDRVGYSLPLGLVRVDYLEAEQLVADARRDAAAGRWAQALAATQALAALFDGEPLAGLPSTADEAARQGALELRAAARLLQAEALRLLGRPAEAAELVRDRATANPNDEPAQCVFLAALGDAGRPNEALAIYHRLKGRLRRTGADPSPALRAVFARLLNPPEPAPAVAVARPGSAPAALPPAGAPIIGRDRELAELAELLAAGNRLVTLVGTGGIGKTRLATAGAAQATAGLRLVAFADLTLAREPAEVVPVVASAVGADVGARADVGAGGADVAAVLAALRTLGPALVVLDNAEHVLDAVRTLVGDLLTVPTTTLLVTSRSPLGLRDETAYRLEGLRPDAGDDPGVTLLARRAGLGSAQTRQQMPALRELADRADRIPLMLELLAAQLLWQSAEELLAGLAETLPGLSDDAPDRPVRHFSFAATVEWSLRGTPAPTRAALGALTLPRGAFDLAAATEILSAAVPGMPARRLVIDLVERSLLQRVPGPGRIRFRLLEPIRLCATASELVPHPGPAARLGHAAHYLRRLEEASRDGGMDSVVALSREEEADLRAAMDWCLAHDPDRALASLGSLQWAWYGLNRMPEVLRWTERARAGSRPGPGRAQVAVIRLTMLTLLRQGVAEWDALCAEIAPHAAGFDASWHHRWARARADVLGFSGDPQGALDWLGRSRPRSPQERVVVGARRVEFLLLAGRCDDAKFQLDLLTGLVSLGEPTEDLPRLYRQIWVAALHGYLAMERGRFDVAEGRCREIEGWIQQAQKLCAAPLLDEWAGRLQVQQAWLAWEDGAPATAARLLGAAIGALDMPSIRLEALAAAGLALRRLDRAADAEWAAAVVAGLAPDNLRFVYPYKRDRVRELLDAYPVPAVVDGPDTNMRLVTALRAGRG